MRVDATDEGVRDAIVRLVQANTDGAHPLVRYLLMTDLADALIGNGQAPYGAVIHQLAELVRNHAIELEQARLDAVPWWRRRRYLKDRREEPNHTAEAAWYRAMT